MESSVDAIRKKLVFLFKKLNIAWLQNNKIKSCFKKIDEIEPYTTIFYKFSTRSMSLFFSGHMQKSRTNFPQHQPTSLYMIPKLLSTLYHTLGRYKISETGKPKHRIYHSHEIL